jgi:hypothetical protein
MLCACAATAAGQNPGAMMYISFDQSGAGGLVHQYTPFTYESFRAYVCLTGISGGVSSASFSLADPTALCPGQFAPPTFVNLLPYAEGEWHSGITVSSPECLSGPVVVLGYLQLFTIAPGDCCIEILNHPDYPRWVTDCQDPVQLNHFNVLSNGEIGGAYCPVVLDYDTYVVCEPQEPPNATHPPSYWYRVGSDENHYPSEFRVQVFDSDPTNYTNWVDPGVPPDQWTHSFEYDGENTWVVWNGSMPILFGEVMFGFDNPNPADWGAWELGAYSSEQFSDYSDGYGYRVHVPVVPTPVEDASWSCIKALFR